MKEEYVMPGRNVREFEVTPSGETVLREASTETGGGYDLSAEPPIKSMTIQHYYPTKWTETVMVNQSRSVTAP